MTFKSQDNNPDSFTVKTDAENFLLEQDVQAYRDYAKDSREISAYSNGRMQKFKPLCIIPDIVAIKLLVEFGIDVHSADFMHDDEKKKKVVDWLRLEAPDLFLF